VTPAPVWTLGAIWWFVMGALGFFFPYYAFFLNENAGLTGTQVGAVLGVIPMMGLIAQPLWGQFADRTGLRGRVVGLLALGTALGYASLSLATGFTGYLAFTCLFAVFFPALMPSCVAASFASLDDPSGTRFGRVRAMGTVGFGVSVGCLPFLLEGLRSWKPELIASETPSGVGEPGLEMIFYLAAGLAMVAACAGFALPARGAMALRAEPDEWRRLLHNSHFVRLILFTFVAYLANQGPTVLFPLLVRAQGGGIEAVSRMWLIMIVLEIPLIFYFGIGVARFGPRGVIAIGLGAAALRWLVSALATDLRWVYFAQLLHGVMVWGLILGAPVYMDAVIPKHLRSTGQALLAMVGIGMGSMLSNLTAGVLVDAVGPKAPALAGGLASALLLLSIPWLLPAVDVHRRLDSQPG
jgi:PPP family 3-phenylpropionic acid transporter